MPLSTTPEILSNPVLEKTPECHGLVAEVAVFLPVDRIFSYRVPREWQPDIKVGQRVLVPFGSRKLTGHVVSLREEGEKREANLKPLLELQAGLFLNPSLLEFFQWIARYYHTPLGEVLRSATPTGINLKSMRLVTLTEKGRSFIDPQMVDSTEDRIFKMLEEKGPSRISRLKRLEGVTEAVLKRLEKMNLITIDSRLEKLRVKILRTKIVRLNPMAEEGAKEVVSGKRNAIFSLLQEKKEMVLSQLEKEIKGSRAVVKRLAEQGIVSIELREGYRDPLLDYEMAGIPSALELTDDQRQALERVYAPLDAKKFETFLLYGITGSGKTEVYIRAAQYALSQNREVIVLVPEISIATQMVKTFRMVFGNQIALLHSQVSEGERFDQWRKILAGDLKIAIGARSAVFAPFQNLGLVIIDEEHEASFKQEKGFFYHGRDIAVARARLSQAVAILGSATPSVETFYKGQTKKFSLLKLPERVGGRPLPTVEIIDMRVASCLRREGAERKKPIFSKDLGREIEACLTRGEQSLLLLNRRGYAPVLLCDSCGEAIACPHCAISLTYYREANLMRCHYCDHAEPTSPHCPKCKDGVLSQVGIGTETLEEELKSWFSKARILRMDRDTTARKGSHRRMLESVQKGEVDILLGTQMIAKGLHFPRVTLVGVISADVALHMPDYRASERTFQLLTQVAGRAGREDLLGNVLIQTYHPDHYSVICARNHDFERFYDHEIQFRKELSYPPFSRLIAFRFSALEKKMGEKAMTTLRDHALGFLSSREEYRELISVLGPCQAPIARLKGLYRWQILLKSAQSQILHRYAFQLQKWLEREPTMRALKFQIDVDPGSLL